MAKPKNETYDRRRGAKRSDGVACAFTWCALVWREFYRIPSTIRKPVTFRVIAKIRDYRLIVSAHLVTVHPAPYLLLLVAWFNIRPWRSHCFRSRIFEVIFKVDWPSKSERTNPVELSIVVKMFSHDKIPNDI